MQKRKMFPLRFDDAIHARIDAQLLDSVIKSKNAYILKAVEEKLERDAQEKAAVLKAIEEKLERDAKLNKGVVKA